MGLRKNSDVTPVTNTMHELVELLLEACVHLREQAGFAHGTGSDGAFLDRAASKLSAVIENDDDLEWLLRIRRRYGVEKVIVSGGGQ